MSPPGVGPGPGRWPQGRGPRRCRRAADTARPASGSAFVWVLLATPQFEIAALPHRITPVCGLAFPSGSGGKRRGGAGSPVAGSEPGPRHYPRPSAVTLPAERVLPILSLAETTRCSLTVLSAFPDDENVFTSRVQSSFHSKCFEMYRQIKEQQKSGYRGVNALSLQPRGKGTPVCPSWVPRRHSLFVLGGWKKGSFTQEYSCDLMLPP